MAPSQLSPSQASSFYPPNPQLTSLLFAILPLEIRQQIYREVAESVGWGKLHILYRSVKIANEEAIRQKKHVMYYHTWQWQLTYTPCTLPPNYQKPIYVRQDPLT
jgi:hypothetical protein